jgi:ParB-like chromosome segregation protein Spo0J
MNIKNIKIGELTPYEKNTKNHGAKQIANVAESIRQYGFVQPLVVDAHRVVVIGHCRLLAAKKLNMTEVPCVCVDDLTDEQVRALRIVDNKSNESPWDFDLLGDELADIDLSGFDFDFGLESDASGIAIDLDETTNDKKPAALRCPKCGFEFEA